jgi:hypothetical protein
MCLGNKQLGRVWFLLVNHAVREVKTVRYMGPTSQFYRPGRPTDSRRRGGLDGGLKVGNGIISLSKPGNILCFVKPCLGATLTATERKFVSTSSCLVVEAQIPRFSAARILIFRLLLSSAVRGNIETKGISFCLLLARG